jgi:ABC-type multidrug transport system ATPase subunit
MSSNSCVLHPNLLQVENLSGGPGTEAVFENLSFSWPPGLSWIMGDEGTGKTSLLRILGGALRPFSGSVHVSPGGVFWADLSHSTHDHLTVQACWDNLQSQYPLWRSDLLEALCQALDMERHRHKRLEMLSTGSRRKVTLIAALVSGATLTLLDQPFASLDSSSVRIVKDFLSEVADQKNRVWIVADYEVPEDLQLSSLLKLETR